MGALFCENIPTDIYTYIYIHMYIYIQLHIFPVHRCLTHHGSGDSCCRLFVLKFNLVVIPMDHPLFAPAAIGSFVLGWLAREWSTYPPKLESVPCKCQCNCNTSGSSEVGWLGNVLVLVGCVLGCLLVCSNAALAFRFSYRDSESGKRHEFSVGVKGKKGGFGVYGVPKGLQLTEG